MLDVSVVLVLTDCAMISHCVCDFTSLFISPLLPLMDVLVVSGFIAVIFLVQVPCYASDSLGNKVGVELTGYIEYVTLRR